MNVHPEEFVSARDMSRSLGVQLDRLNSGTVHKLVIMNRNKPQAVILTVAEFERWFPQTVYQENDTRAEGED